MEATLSPGNRWTNNIIIMLCFIYLPPSLHQVMEMIKQKEKLEEEIRALQEVLNTQNVGEEFAIDHLFPLVCDHRLCRDGGAAGGR